MATKKTSAAVPEETVSEAVPVKETVAPKTRAKKSTQAVFVQYQGGEVEVSALLETAKAKFKEENKRTTVSDIKLYVKPEENAAYYVINDSFNGKIEY